VVLKEGWVALFPGQGSQFPGMGRDLWEGFPEARAVFQEADEALGWPLSRICFEGPEEELNRTSVTQPAVLTVSLAAWEVLRRRGWEVEAAAGLSSGEYAALVAAGSLSFAHAVWLVHKRGLYMEEASPPGAGMAALLGLPTPEVEEICTSVRGVEPVNYNCPGQVVVAGLREALEEVARRAEERGARKVVFLPVSGPFHSRFMEPVRERLREALGQVEIRDARVPVVSNARAAWIRRAGEIREALVEQVASPVLWEQSMRFLLREGYRSFLELGPGRTLSGFMKRIAPEARVVPAGTAEALRELEVERV